MPDSSILTMTDPGPGSGNGYSRNSYFPGASRAVARTRSLDTRWTSSAFAWRRPYETTTPADLPADGMSGSITHAPTRNLRWPATAWAATSFRLFVRRTRRRVCTWVSSADDQHPCSNTCTTLIAYARRICACFVWDDCTIQVGSVRRG